MLSILRGLIRLLLVILLISLGVLPVVLLSLIPVRYRGAKLGPWLTYYISHAFNRIFNIHSTCTDKARMARHHGLVLANHSSYLDIIALLNAAPIRFLAAQEVQRQPIIGWFAMAQETVFVNRSNRASRGEARDAVSAALQSDPFPPIAIFAEGRLGPGDRLNPYRFGAFELAVQNEVAFLPCAIRYNRPDIVTWHGGSRNEWMPAAVWRLARHKGRIEMTLIPLTPMHPTRNDDPALLAAITQRCVEQVLGFPPAPLSLDDVQRAKWDQGGKKRNGAPEQSSM